MSSASSPCSQPHLSLQVTRECGICFELFKTPKLLPCFHTFCLKCLQDLVANLKGAPNESTFLCPICRARITIPTAGVEKFQTNFYIEAAKVSSDVRDNQQCNVCEELPAKNWCSDCEQFLCKTCTKYHASISATRNHTMLNMGSVSSAELAKYRLINTGRCCDTHPREIVGFFCNQCKQVICRDCLVTTHKGHDTADISAKASEVRQFLDLFVSKSVNDIQPQLKQIMKEVEKDTDELRKQRDKFLAVIQSRGAEIKRAVDDCMAEAEKQIDSTFNEESKTANISLQLMEEKLACLLSMTDYVHQALSKGDDAEVMLLPNQVESFFGVQQESSETDPVAALNVSNIFLASDSELKSFSATEWRSKIEQMQQALQPNKSQMNCCIGQVRHVFSDIQSLLYKISYQQRTKEHPLSSYYQKVTTPAAENPQDDPLDFRGIFRPRSAYLQSLWETLQ